VVWDIEVLAEHDSYNSASMAAEVETIGTFEVNRVIQSESIVYLDPIRMTTRPTVTK
jgi:hypothetical protein